MATKRPNFRREPIQLKRLLLDTENPRHDPIQSEPEIIDHLVKHEKVYRVAKDIVARGSVSPLESVGAYPHPTKAGYFVVAEGNRRVCAFKLLHDPDLAPSGTWRRRFNELSATAPLLPATIEVVVFNNEADSLQWKELRHNGEQEGVGTRKWKAEQKARNDMKLGRVNANQCAMQMLDYAQASAIVTEEQRKRIPVTTLTRHLNNPVLRDVLGVGSASEFVINAPQGEVNIALGKFLHDAIPTRGADGLDSQPVNSRNKKRDVESYAAKLRASGKAVHTRLSRTQVPAAGGPKKSRNNASPNNRQRVVPAGFAITIADRHLKRVYDELRRLPIAGESEFPIAAVCLLEPSLSS